MGTAVTLDGATYELIGHDLQVGKATTSGITGSETKQDLSPSALQVAQQIPGDTDIAVSGIIAYGDAQGAVGLSDRVLAPGDFSRPFLCELDNTRPRQMSSWIGTVNATPLTIGAGHFFSTNPYQYGCLVDAGSGFGYVTQSSLPDYEFYQWNQANAAFTFQRVTQQPAYPYLVSTSYASRAAMGTYRFPPAIAQDYAGGIWMSANGGLTDISVVGALYGDANTAMCCVYLDILFSFGLTTSGLTITPYRFKAGQTPNTAIGTAANAQVQRIDVQPGSSTYGNTIPSTVTIPGEYAINGVIASEGAFILVTDRSAYALIWNDTYNTISFDRLPINLPRFTSAPVSWNGEVWIGAGNQIIHIAPHQGNYDTVYVDEIGRMPSPFSGRIVQLMATPAYLAAYLIDDGTTTPANATIMLRDAGGAWKVRKLLPNVQYTAQHPLLQKMDANGFSFAVVDSQNATRQYPLLDAGKNPVNLPVGQRTQEGTQRIIFPWEYGTNESALKRLTKMRLEFQGVGARTAITQIAVYFQIDQNDKAGATAIELQGPFSYAPGWTGIAANTGQWDVAMIANASSVGDYGSATNGYGSGYLWTEFDGTAAVGLAAQTGSGITSVSVQNGGSGYTSPPSAAYLVTPTVALGATVTANLTGGAVSSFTVGSPGTGTTTSNTLVYCYGGKLADDGSNSGSGFSNPEPGAYPLFRRIRWMIEINGDTTGTLLPMVNALIFYYQEYPSVTYQYNVSLRLRRRDLAAAGALPTVAAQLLALESLKNKKRIVSYTDVRGVTTNVQVTKITSDVLGHDTLGPSEVNVHLTLQQVPFSGNN